jgi:RNA polymerase sigma factor (sigma-70 family)
MRNNPQELAQQWIRFTQGDEAAFAFLFRTFHPFLYRYGHRLTRNDELTRDCIQVVFMNLWAKREKRPAVTQVRAYLFRAMRNEVLKRHEQGRRASSLHSEYTAVEADVVFSSEELVTQAEAFQMKREALAEALNTLSKREREVVYLHYYENLEYREIAGIMSVHYQSVLNCLHVAFRKLRGNATLRRVVDLSLPLLAYLVG